MEEEKIFKDYEVVGKTKYTRDEVLDIAKEFLAKQETEYHIFTDLLTYDLNFYKTNEPTWSIHIIPVLDMVRFPDMIELLIISDISAKPIYIMSHHGRLFDI